MRRSVFAIVPRFRRPQAARKLRAGRELLGQRGEAAPLCEAKVATAGALLASRIRHAIYDLMKWELVTPGRFAAFRGRFAATTRLLYYTSPFFNASCWKCSDRNR